MAKPRKLNQVWPALRRILTRFGPYIRKQRLLIAGSFAALIAEAFLRILEPWPLKFIFDRLIKVHSSSKHPFSQYLSSLDTSTLIAGSAIILVLVTGLRALADYANTIGFAKIGNRVLTDVRADLYSHLQKLSLSFHTRARNGDLILRVMGDINLLKDVVVTALLPLVANILVLVGMVGVMVWLNWKLALLSLVPLPLFYVFTVRITKRIQAAAKAQRHRESVMAAATAESLGAIKLIQALALEPVFSKAFERRNQESRKEDVRGHRLTASLERTVAFAIAVSTSLVLWYGVRLVINEELSPGDLIVFLTCLRATFKPVQDFAKYTGRLAKATAAGDRVLDLLERKPEVMDRPDAVAAPPFVGHIRFDRVGFGYEKHRLVLDQVDFEVQPGQRVALVGSSGSGKSTIANLILRLYDPTKGQVLIDNHDIRTLTLASVRAQISIVLQETLLFAASIRENIAYGAADATDDRIENALRLANAQDFVEVMSDGLDSPIGERGTTLSGGERQRLAIARAMIRHSPILLLDEPTAGLDEENEQKVIKALENLAQGRTTLLITHDLALAARSDEIFYLEKGRILERGKHEDLLQAGGRYASLFRQQVYRPGSPLIEAQNSCKSEVPQ
ncbi:MAG TPA: ABC transporter ATP-binding protein [Gemmataceae bacterium]|nr:ABC transporter ATP-binding protein [Gemmataceae bacterium]